MQYGLVPPLLAPITYFVDADNDTFGSTATAAVCSTVATLGYSLNNTDCSDSDATVNTRVRYYYDSDLDTYGSSSNTLVCASTPPSGFSTVKTDCDDDDASIHPNALENCANLAVDNNCNGIATDAEAVDSTTYYVDTDADSYGAGALVKSCSVLVGYVLLTECSGGVEPVGQTRSTVVDPYVSLSAST